MFRRSWIGGLAILVGSAAFGASMDGAEIRLKNGTTLRGQFLVMSSLGGRAVGEEALRPSEEELKREKDRGPTPHNIGRIDNGWQRIYFPLLQRDVSSGGQAAGLASQNPVAIPMPPPRRSDQGLVVSTFGSIADVTPFDEYGRRRLKIVTPKKMMDVFQSITEVHPDHVLVESTNCNWKLGLPLKTIPIETLEPMLKMQVKRDDAVARFALVRFYSQAEHYPQAFAELDAIEKDLPERKELVDKSREELMNYFGDRILRRLERRKRAGQFELAEAFARKLLSQPLTGTVMQKVRQTIQEHDQARRTIDQAKLLLSEWQAKLNDEETAEKLQPLRSEINEQLSMGTLPRLDAFLKAENDKQYDPSQRLGLAYSGWVLGSANATPDLSQTLRIWEARNIAIDALRSDDIGIQADKIDQLKKLESVSPQTVLKLVAQLPPILDASEIRPGAIHQVTTTGIEGRSYAVALPAEYSPLHTYPLLIVLRARNRTIEQAVEAWTGDLQDPDLGSQRGYIVIAPDYADPNQDEYTYGTPAHQYVLDCLVDARKRFAVDSDRVFLTGHGMGGDAAFDIGLSHPDEFAGVLPIGGNAVNYCVYNWQNGSHTAWYVVGKGYDSKDNRDPSSNLVFDNMLIRGSRFDFMLVEYLGRNGENLFDECSKLFDWMDTHVRRPMPKEFEVRTLRKGDNRFFWVTANGLARDYILPAPPGAAQRVIPMEVDARITPGNTLIVKSAAAGFTVRLSPELIDFDKKVVMKLGNQSKSENIFLKPDAGVVIEELRQRGDRNRLPLAVITR
ncbi:hypothetical protein [Schlesneria sp.]|uniref:hypothetical protein n=1 Tax=Schlesneria sp. TaxID=2762018 RepID=UPI002F006574